MSETAQKQTSKKQTLSFQAEVKQLLHLVAHAMYSNEEIFLRELVSNASDAIDKLRFMGLKVSKLYENDTDFKIWVSFDKDNKTITVRDNGIGMSHDEVIENLGTIAQSGTRKFLSGLSKDQSKDSKLIGQFGVGFYSAFVVADKVTVLTRKAGVSEKEGVCWESDGQGEFTISAVDRPERGTEITLHLKKDKEDFLDNWRLRSIITKYSDHIDLPIMMLKQDMGVEDKKDDAEEKAEKKPEWEAVNRATALWTRAKSDVKDEEYQEFYKHISHDFRDALVWDHRKVEGKQEYTSLLYIPSEPPFDLYQRDQKHGLKLYVQRVFIMDDVEQFLPTYLRFVRGVIDSNDLPLNISREILQNNRSIEVIKSALTKRILDMLTKLAKDDAEKYKTFWKAFGKVLKEGPAEDFANKEKIAKLFRFSSTLTDSEDETVSLDEYISRMKEGSDKIYYVTADSFVAAKNSPHLEVFRKKGIEVLLLKDRVDEWLVSHLSEYEGKKLTSVARGDLDLGEVESEEEKEHLEKAKKEFSEIVDQVKKILEKKVKEVRLSTRLTNSPACIVADEHDMNANMQRILKSLGQPVPEAKPIFELNPDHMLLHRLRDEADEDRFKELVWVLFDQAVLAEGGSLENPAEFVQRLNHLLMSL